MKSHIKKILPESLFARNVSILAGGTAAGASIAVLTSPLLTRLYKPEEFGLLAVFTALLAILSVVASLRYQLAIPLPENDQDAAHVAVLGLLIVLFSSTIVAVLVFFYAQTIANLCNTPELSKYLWLLPIGLFFTGIYQLLSLWSIRLKAFSPIARTKLTQALAMVGVQIGANALGSAALILGQIAGQAMGSSSLAVLTVRSRWRIFKNTRWIDVFSVSRRYKRFPMYSTWGGLFSTASEQLPSILFSILFSPGIAGIYMITNRVLAMPMTLIGSSIANVFFSHAVEAKRNGNLTVLVSGIHQKLAHIAMPPTLILILTGPDLFAFAFGDQWRKAGEFSQWMAPWIYLAFVSSPLTSIFDVLEKQAHEMSFQFLLLSTRVLALAIGAYLNNLMLAIGLFSIGSALCYLVVLSWIIRASGNQWAMLWQTAFKAALSALLVISPLLIWTIIPMSNKFIWLIALSVTMGLAAFRYIMLLRNE